MARVIFLETHPSAKPGGQCPRIADGASGFY
jgi:hypothetical protein